jgi:hypothetical protein
VTAVATAPAEVKGRAMISPLVDTACIGGLSILASAGLLLFCPVPFDKHVPPLLPYALTVLITWPHFLSSYRLLYASRESALAHPWASIYVPGALAAYGIFAVVRSGTDPVHIHVLMLVAGVYLARHYTGQTWGMMASFSHIAGTPFIPAERRAAQWSLHLIMAWHITWAAARTVGDVVPQLGPGAWLLDAHVDPVAYASFAMGLVTLGIMAKRIGRLPPVRVIVPWLALYGWYAMLRKDPTSLVIVQAAHALQYLIFPLRIEETRRAPGARAVRPGRAAVWVLGLVALGLGVFAGLPGLFRIGYANAGGAGDVSAAFLSVFVSFVNIHHYFIDGCLYKLRNPAVRRDLFAHLQPAKGA